MTPDEIDRIEARAEAATEGPWALHMIQPDMGGRHQYGMRQDGNQRPDGTVLNSTRIKGGDAEFIAASRADVPALVAEVRALRDQRDTALAIHADDDGLCLVCVGDGYVALEWPCPTVVALTGKDTER